jgi:C1A family cysteine protease
MGQYYSTKKSADETPAVKRVYGWKKDEEDPRDLKKFFTVHPHLGTVRKVDLRANCPPVWDQGNLGSCSAQSVGGVYEYALMKEVREGSEKTEIFEPSQLFIYYNERKRQGTIEKDSGSTIRTGIKTLNAVGVCPENLWPYDITKFTDEPPAECYESAKKHRAIAYHRVQQSLHQLKMALMEGFPVAFGFKVFKSFESDSVAKTGIVPMPKPDEEFLGGHAVNLVGYDDDEKVFIVRNSWGTSWGDSGCAHFPYDYITDPNLSSDFWVVSLVKDI